MAWENAVLSENRNDVEACLTERGYQADISTRVTAESTSSALFSTVASRARQALRGKGVNDGFARKVGRFETADRGTLFLDEIGDIPLELQAKLLRVLQEGEFERLGSTQTQRVDVWLVAATNRDLADMVSKKQFRSDLYYRLNVFPIAVPPLRDRLQDISLLVEHFVKTFSEQMGKQIREVPAEVMEALVSHFWPGNIRELQNFIERSVILSFGNVLRPPLANLKAAAETKSVEAITLEEAERNHIRKILKHTRWIVSGPSGAAARLGIKRSKLYFRMQKLGISRPNGEPVPA